MKHFPSSSPTVSFLLAIAVCTAVHSLDESFHRAEKPEEDKHFVSDPSAKVDGIFRKEGDMTFILHSDPFADDFDPQNDGRQKRNAILGADNLWPNKTIPYEISSVFSDQEIKIIKSAMRHWEENTCIRFRPKVSSDIYYIFIMSGPTGVCQSFVGRIHRSYQPQGVTLGQYCVHFSTVVHELGHVIGLYHEHNRPDRDEHIEILTENIQQGLESAFDKIAPGRSNLLGYGYDYASIMHYSEYAFSGNNQKTIRAKDPTIPFGNAEELSPLDICKVIELYNCGPKSTWPPISTVVPNMTLSLPIGVTCGQVSNGSLSGTYRSPGHPNYRHNLDCAYVIKVPKGYYVQLTLRNFAIEESSGCSKDYVQIYYGTELNSANLARFSGTTEGRICDNLGYTSLIYTIYSETVTVYFHTDASGSGTRGLEVTFTAVDEDECSLPDNNCHQCNNRPGGYECVCQDGYYHSVAAKTCYDVNECAYDNGGCDHKCTNSGGSYECSCNTGYFLQADGKKCETTAPVSKCGVNFTTASGSFHSTNWPETYDTDTNCEWFIQLPDVTKLVEITCGDESPFSIAGAYPSCVKDYLTIYDGHSAQSVSRGPYCGFTSPNTIQMSSNLAKVFFHAGPSHNPSRRGFKCSFRSVDAPLPPTTPPPTLPPSTTPPPTMPPVSKCGVNFTTASGSFHSTNWPETYDTDTNCEWFIQLPDATKLVEITCGDESPFSIAGAYPSCVKDYLTIYDGHSAQSVSHGPYCGFTSPNTIQMSSNLAKVFFHAGPSHNPSRRGFKCSFRSVDAPLPPTTPPPTLPPSTTPPPTTPPVSKCGVNFTTASGSFHSTNWPETYDTDTNCEWFIQLPDVTKLVEITCGDESPFSIAGAYPSCVKDYLTIYDGHSAQSVSHGPYCGFTSPNTIQMSSNLAKVFFYAGPSHNPSRRGFKCSFRSVDAPLPPTTPPPTTPPPTTFPPTLPPTTISPSSSSLCGGTLTATSGSFQTPNWPETYPVNVDCEWTITLPESSKRVQITIGSGFGIAGRLPDCVKDKLTVYDSSDGTQYGPFCHFAVPLIPLMSSNKARIVFNAGPAHNPSRHGFFATYTSV